MSSESVTARDIAIIGLAVRFPEADDLTQLFTNLCDGRDSVRELSMERKIRTSLPLDETYQQCGYIEDIDSFDHAFFDIAKGEADNMAPQHRMLLQTTYQAVENAAYDPAELRGQRGSVYVGDTKVMYDELAASLEPTMVMGSHVSAMAGRLSRFLGLRGPAAMIDSSCSSSLTAVNFAVNDLLLDEADLAVVACASLNIFADRLTGEIDIGIRSPDGKTRCFSADAAGTGSGEAVAALVLKRLDRAVRDGDRVHAVIKSVAVNNVGGRGSTLTAPDSGAEAEVMERAWAKAGIDPRTISYIEAHGTATRLGDPIEIEAIDAAFGRVTSDKQFCALSSVKSNFGHTWSASGLAGLVKAVLSVRHRVLFPNLHSGALSPLIDFANSAVVVTRELTPWEPSCGVRRAGVSSFGVMGTNAHAVLEEAPPREPAAEPVPGPYWLPVSAKSAGSLTANVAAVRQWIDEHPELPLADVQRTLVGGRAHYEHRFCAAARDRDDLWASLDSSPPARTVVPDVVALVVSGGCTASGELTAALRSDYPPFDERYTACEQAGADPEDQRAAAFAFRYAFVGVLRHLGLRFVPVISEGSGKLVIDADHGRLALDEALRRAGSGQDEPRDLEARVDQLLARFPGKRVLFVEAGPLATVTRAIAERGRPDQLTVGMADGDGFAHFLRGLYLAGLSWTWEATAGRGRRIELPSYQFERTRCWLPDVRVLAPSRSGGATAAPPVVELADPADPADTVGTVSAVWQGVLGFESFSAEDSFFALGGDSISSLLVIDRLRTMFGVELDDLAILDHPTPLALADHIDKLRPVEADGTGTLAGDEPFPASAAQVQIWLASQFEGGSVAFNLTRSFRLAGRVDVDALRTAVVALSARHDALRARFAFENEHLVQRIASAECGAGSFEVTDIDEALPDAEALAGVYRPFAGRPVDLEAGPLLRVLLARFAGEQAVVTISTHHIVADGWSLDVLVRDLAELYAAAAGDGVPVLPPIEVGYREHHVRQQHQAAERRQGAERYWFERFADVPPPLDLPTRPNGVAPAFRGSYRTYVLPGELWSRLKQFSRDEGGTPFGCLLSVFAALFAPYSEHGELVLGTSVAGRGAPQSEHLVGMLVRTVPLRLAVGPDATLRALYATVRSAFRDAMANLAYPYEELLRELQRRSVTAAPNLFDVLIEFEQFAGTGADPYEAMMRTGLDVTPVEVTLETSVFPLNIMISEQGEGLAAVVRFDTGLFDERMIDQLWTAFSDLAAILLDSPAERMADLPLLGAVEQARVRTLGYRRLDFDASLTIPTAIERFAVERPDWACLSGPDSRRTYAQLNRRANQLACLFAGDCGVEAGDLVALVMDRSVLTVESILAVWKCGAAYLPVDPAHPPAFIRRMLESATVRVVALDPRQAEPGLIEHLGADYTTVAITDETASTEAGDNLGKTFGPDALAYVIYTSGSTGEPKGAMVEHMGMLNHLHAKIADLALSDRSVVVQTASNSFDISVWQMFAALFVGGHTIVYDQSLQLDPSRVAERLVEDGVTVLEVVPSYLDTLLDTWPRLERPVRLDALEYLLVTGEATHPHLIDRWLDAFPGVPVVNAYGPTEASDDITHHVMTEPLRGASVPLGRPIPNTFVYVLDEHSRIVPQGARGEICVSGICVGRGYLNAPEQTARVFTTDPFHPERRMYRTGDGGRWNADGTLRYFGRSDTQVKVRGFRVDLGEIERRLAEAPGVKAAAVVVPDSTRDRLCAYVVLAPGGSPAACGAYLAHELPHYMVPSHIVDAPDLPLTANGKLDRIALRRRGLPASPSRSSALARSPAEQAVQQVWEEVLGGAVDVNQRFFDVGGNSLRAIQVLSRLRDRLGAEITLEQLFARPTVAALAQLVSSTACGQQDTLPSLGGPGRYDLAPTQHLLLRIEQVLSQRGAFSRNDLYAVHGPLDPVRLEQSFAAVVRRHEVLRTTFDTGGERPMQVVHAPGELPLPFCVHDRRAGDDVMTFVSDQIRRPFDITREPLVRADLLRTGEEDYALLVSMHQLVSDGRSAKVLHDDWLTAYDELAAGRESSGQPGVVQYKDVAHWRSSRLTPERIEAHRRFWRAELDGASPIVPLATDRPRPAVASLDGERLHLDIPDELAAGVATLARDCAVTEFVVARTALALQLCAETSSTDVTVGTYTRGRNRTEVEDGIGFYIHTVPLRLRLASHDDVRSLLAEAQRGALRAFEHEEYPYEWLMHDLGWERGPDRAPLFDVMVAMDDGDEEPAMAHSLCLESQALPRRSKEGDLLVVFRRTSCHLELAVTYDRQLFGIERVRRFALSLRDVLAGMVAGRPVGEILSWARR